MLFSLLLTGFMSTVMAAKAIARSMKLMLLILLIFNPLAEIRR